MKTPINSPRHLLVLAVTLSFLVHAPAQEAVIRSPFVGGNTGGDFPFNVGDSFFPSIRYQQVYDSSDFERRMPQGGFIDAIRFDIADPEFGGHAFAATLAGIQINFSTTARAVDGLSSIFADNVGVDNTVVLGLSAITLSDFLPGGADIIIPFTTPFYYDPSAGNLLMDVFNFGRERTSPFNANNVAGDTTSSVISLGSVNDSSGLPITGGLVTIFQVRPVPEPSTWALVATGLVLAGGWRFLRRTSSTSS